MATDMVEQRVAGMGSIPHENGVAFRVWAPHAQSVSVVGSFNNWSFDANPMQSKENGYWYTNVESAAAGDEYKYHIVNGERQFDRIDPYAREVTNSVGNAIVHEPGFDWGDDHFEMPTFNQIVVYEMHVGTFARAKKDQPGELENAISRFDYLKELGVNVLEIMPVAEFAGDAT